MQKLKLQEMNTPDSIKYFDVWNFSGNNKERDQKILELYLVCYTEKEIAKKITLSPIFSKFLIFGISVFAIPALDASILAECQSQVSQISGPEEWDTLHFAFLRQRRKLIALPSLQANQKNVYSIELYRVLDIL